jgi:hypothetical protein
MMARRKPTPDELREILLAYIEQGDPTNQHGERRQRAFGELMDAGLSDRQALAVLDNPIAVLRSTRAGAEGTPLATSQPEGVSDEDWDSLGPVLDIFQRRTGTNVREQSSLRGSGGNRPQVRVAGDDDDDFTPEELLRGLETAGDVNQYIWANSPNWTTEEAEGVRDFLEENGGANGPYAGSYNQLFLDHEDLTSGSFDGEPVDRDGGLIGNAESDFSFNLEDIGSMSPEELIDYVEDHADEFSEDDINDIQMHVAGLSTANPDWARAATLVQTLAAEGPEAAQEAIATEQADAATRESAEDTAIANAEREDQLEAAIEAGAEIWAQAGSSVKPDLSSIEEMLPAGTSIEELIPEISERAIGMNAREVQQSTGASTEEARVIAEGQTASADLFTASEPDWLLQLNQGNLSEQQKDRYVDYWNDAYGTFFTDFDRELAPLLGRFDGTETEAQNMASAVLANQEPLIMSSITLPLVQGERKATYTPEEMEDLRSMGFSNDAITRLVRLTAITSGEDALRPGASGDTLRVGALAALARYYGGGDEFARFNQTQQEMAALEQQIGLRPGQFSKMTFKQRQELRERLERNTRTVSGITVTDPALKVLAQLEGMGQGLGRREEHGTTPGIIAANNNFRRGMDLYRGDELLAVVHAVDSGLAQRVASTGGDPDKLDWRDNAAVYDILERSGQINSSNTRLRQLESATGFFGYFNTGRGGGGGGGGAGPVRRMIDPVQTKEAIQQLWSRMFLADVDDATVQAMTANLQSQLDAAPEGMNVDISSRIAAFLRGQDVYDELYRNKPAGMSEEEYQSQFAAGVGDVLGNELDPEALKAGMRTGEYNTAVGRAASTEKLLTNSTLRGRWAQAKQTLDQFT